MSYKEIGVVSSDTIDSLKAYLKNVAWKNVKGNEANYKTWHNPYPLLIRQIDELNVMFSDVTQYFFLLIPPKGHLPLHTDTPRQERSFHIPIITNAHCFNFSYQPHQKIHLEVGQVYEVDRQKPHKSVNWGTIDRIHLIVEAKECQI